MFCGFHLVISIRGEKKSMRLNKSSYKYSNIYQNNAKYGERFKIQEIWMRGNKIIANMGKMKPCYLFGKLVW